MTLGEIPRRLVLHRTPTSAVGTMKLGPQAIVEEIAELGALMAREYGDRVDEWVTLNEPINYLLSAYGIGSYPPGRGGVFDLLDEDAMRALLDTVERYAAAHVALYDAIKANDTVDADGDGVAANVGFVLSVVDWVPSRNGELSDDPRDVAAADNLRYVYHQVFTDAFVHGQWDGNLDRMIEESEQRPDWAGKIDFLGPQYYFRAGVTDSEGFNIPIINGFPCFAGLPVTDACVNVKDPTKCIPTMQYEYAEDGLSIILEEFASLWPDLPMTVTEAGIATEVGRRRSENVVRTLEQIWKARQNGVDVRGYYHWSLMDNFEWDLGFAPKFGFVRRRRGGWHVRAYADRRCDNACRDCRNASAQRVDERGARWRRPHDSGVRGRARSQRILPLRHALTT